MIVAGFDIESTGLDYKAGHKIIEIAFVVERYPERHRMGTFVRRINPGRGIDEAARAVHGISLEDLSDEPTFAEVAPKIAKFLKGVDLVIAHNGEGFDIPFIKHELATNGFEVPEFNSFDTMLEGRWATFLGKLPSLKELCFATGIEYDDSKAHAAIYDVEVMLDALAVGCEKGFFKIKEEEVEVEEAELI